jgi:hypothetical protein
MSMPWLFVYHFNSENKHKLINTIFINVCIKYQDMSKQKIKHWHKVSSITGNTLIDCIENSRPEHKKT